MSHPIELGFSGGAVVRLTVESAQVDSLSEALESGGWHAIDADEGRHFLNLGDAIYLRVDRRSTEVGFSTN